jgi:hypothetical protein
MYIYVIHVENISTTHLSISPVLYEKNFKNHDDINNLKGAKNYQRQVFLNMQCLL